MEAKICNFCGNRNFKETNTPYMYRRELRFLLINHVPCEECKNCGEQYFKADTLKKIENDFDNIYFRRKKVKMELHLPVEEFVEI